MKKYMIGLLGLSLVFICGCFTPDLTIKDHRASFLFDNGGTRVMNILAYNIGDAQFNGVINRCKANGDKVIYLYVGYNYGDGAGITSIYVNDQFGGQIDKNKVNLMKNRMKKIREKDLYIVGWLFADDNKSKVNFADTAALKAYAKNIVNNFDSYISEYVVALEADEYLKVRQVDELAILLKSETDKPIGVHMTPGQTSFSALGSINKHYHQYGFNKPDGYIQSETGKAIGALKKPVIGAEYDLSSDSPAAKSRGDAVIRGGGSGTGNGRN